MKKMLLTVPKPCHENWNAMSPDERGRFCNSCQKTVVDFSEMNDRQLAQFFKQPVDSVCGRFHNDQLNREIALSQKRIPWLKYFFTITLPAFLASCDEENEMSIGKSRVKEEITTGDTVQVSPSSIVGLLVPNTEVVDTTAKKMPAEKKKVVSTPPLVVGELTPLVVTEQCTITIEAAPSDTTAIETAPMDTVNISGYRNVDSRSYMMGGLTVISTKKKEQPVEHSSPEKGEEVEVLAYPNPVRAGAGLTIALSANSAELTRLQFFSSTGALVNVQQNRSGKSKTISLMMPSSLTAGTYFLRLLFAKGETKTVKIIVLN